jgi:peptidyl-prolyl cis-trans isomerase D
MITLMRRHRKTLQVGLLLVVVAFVASLFIFGTSGVGGDGEREAVGTVNGEAIPLDRYQRRYRAAMETYAQVYRDRFSPALAEQMGLPRLVVDQLVQEALVVQRARVEGLQVSDEELNARIHAMAAFHEGGRFALRRYQEVLRRAGFTPGGFESDMRRELTRMKVEAAVKGGVKVSEAELEQAYQRRHEEVGAQWALVELSPILAATTVSEAELEAHLKRHEADFRQPERRRIQYVLLATKDFTKPVPEAEVERYYREHPKEFATPRQVRAAHVLARVAETGGSEAEDRARAKIADVIRRAKAGEDFAALAKALSEDAGTAPNGGDLGLLSPGEVVPQFEQALQALRKGELTAEPVRTPFGFHAIKVLDVREGAQKTLKEAAPQIRERLAGEAAEKAARARADEVRPPLQSAPDFMSAARALGLDPKETTLLRTDRARTLGLVEPMEEAAFELALDGVSPPVRTATGVAVVKALQAFPAGVPPLSEIKEPVTLAARRAKAETAALDKAKALHAEAKSGDLLAAARKAGASTGEAARFSRSKPPEKLPGAAVTAALGTPVGALTEPVRSQQGVFVLKVLARRAADLKDFPTEREKLQREILSQKQSLAWEAWLKAARAGAKIQVSGQVFPPRG